MLGGGDAWSPANPGSIVMTTGDIRGDTNYSATKFIWTAAHEFIHILGVGDAYPNNPDLPTIANGPHGKYNVQNIDIEMILEASITGKWQDWP